MNLNDLPQAQFDDLCRKSAELQKRYPEANPWLLAYNMIVRELDATDDDDVPMPFVVDAK